MRFDRPKFLVVAACATFAILSAGAQSLIPRHVPEKVFHTTIKSHTSKTRIVVKLAEGETADLANGGFTGADHARLAGLNQLVHAIPLANVRRMFIRAADTLRAEKQQGEQRSGRQLADLTLYFIIEVPDSLPTARVEALIDALNALDIVEVAYPEPIPEPARADISPPTPTFESQQGYLNAAPQGVDARYAWALPGGAGNAMKFIDVENAWRTSHEDLKDPFVTLGQPLGSDLEHGTAVLGVVIGDSNGFGITGIAPQAGFGTASPGGSSTPAVINSAAAQLSPGDAILIEFHIPSGVNTGETCSCNTPQCGYVPIEFYQAEFDAIAAATALGVVVVEAGGNGSSNLDNAAYLGKFNRSVRDSGAILVGASVSTSRSPTCWTNHGSRIDLHGWGENVVTTGYSGLWVTADPNQYYTGTFAGTSSASPMVVGSVLALQGVKKAAGGPTYTPAQVRSLLVANGTPQSSHPWAIGPQPDLRATIVAVSTPSAIYSPAPGSTLPSSSVTFQWTSGLGIADRYLSVGSSAGGGQFFAGYVGAATSKLVSDLPTNGSTVYVRLSSWINGGWQVQDYTYTAVTPSPSAMISPSAGATLPSSVMTFTWTPGFAVADRYFTVGTTPTGGEIFASYVGAATSQVVSGLPTNQSTVYVRLHSWINGGWQTNPYTYTAADGNRSLITSPVPGGTLPSSSTTFQWSAGTGVADRYLSVGSTPGGGQFFAAYVGNASSQQVSGLPTNGSTVYARLSSWINGGWQFYDYTFTASQ